MKILHIVFCILCACGAPERGEPGPPGPAGPSGPQGAMGIPGATGATSAITVVSKIRCSKVSGNLFEYQTTLFSNGMRVVSCGIGSSAVTLEVTELFSADQNGQTTGGCIVGYDVDTASFGYWQFTLSPRRAVYNDATSPSHLLALTFADTDCTF